MTTESKARRLYESDRARLVAVDAPVTLFPNVGNTWDQVDNKVKATYYEFVAQGDYEIEFEEDTNE